MTIAAASAACGVTFPVASSAQLPLCDGDTLIAELVIGHVTP
ncbi:hypothetical protein [Pengzhenrongella phosphoraccumulans]